MPIVQLLCKGRCEMGPFGALQIFDSSLCDNVPPLQLSLDQLVTFYKSYQNFLQHR